MATKPKRPTLNPEAERQERQDAIALEGFEQAQAMTPERAQGLRDLLADVDEVEERKSRDVN